jgi:hypothetical protein
MWPLRDSRPPGLPNGDRCSPTHRFLRHKGDHSSIPHRSHVLDPALDRSEGTWCEFGNLGHVGFDTNSLHFCDHRSPAAGFLHHTYGSLYPSLYVHGLRRSIAHGSGHGSGSQRPHGVGGAHQSLVARDIPSDAPSRADHIVRVLAVRPPVRDVGYWHIADIGKATGMSAMCQ